jgi:hypothetical protein
MKVAHFPPVYESFAQARTYRDWMFAYAPRDAAAKPAARAPGGGAAPASR